ncbi:glycosyltransferase family 2 protein [[Clostridium] spiroforme]|nr:glycosyltransferase family 2 protein [Thomasclavelia spiroformis]
MDVSVIIPYYKGKKYLDSLLDMLDKNNQQQQYQMEVIFVNDYPQETLIIEGQHNYDVIVLNNEVNMGIHHTRVNGLNKAKGKYILFLDQDDQISENYLSSQLAHINDADVCISNGIMESETEKHLIYKNKRSQDYLKKQIGFIKVRDLIVSPGQCLIKKESIPTFWKENFLTVNCADDYMLFLLMIDNKCKFAVNYDILYTHKYTGVNISNDIHQNYKSNMAMIDLIKDELKNINVDLLKRCIQYKYDMKLYGKIKPSIKNLDLFIYNIVYQLLWKGM